MSLRRSVFLIYWVIENNLLTYEKIVDIASIVWREFVEFVTEKEQEDLFAYG